MDAADGGDAAPESDASTLLTGSDDDAAMTMCTRDRGMACPRTALAPCAGAAGSCTSFSGVMTCRTGCGCLKSCSGVCPNSEIISSLALRSICSKARDLESLIQTRV